jgi:hypothetical protein
MSEPTVPSPGPSVDEPSTVDRRERAGTRRVVWFWTPLIFLSGVAMWVFLPAPEGPAGGAALVSMAVLMFASLWYERYAKAKKREVVAPTEPDPAEIARWTVTAEQWETFVTRRKQHLNRNAWWQLAILAAFPLVTALKIGWDPESVSVISLGVGAAIGLFPAVAGAAVMLWPNGDELLHLRESTPELVLRTSSLRAGLFNYAWSLEPNGWLADRQLLESMVWDRTAPQWFTLNLRTSGWLGQRQTVHLPAPADVDEARAIIREFERRVAAARGAMGKKE